MKKTYALIAMAASMSFAAKIGVLVDQGSCPSDHYPTIIRLDAEDSDNATKYYGYDKKPIGITGKKEVTFSYCVFDYDELHKMNYDYVVLRLDEKCPEGAMAFARYEDTENSNNKNYPKGDFSVWPSVIDNNAKQEFCFVPKATGSEKVKYPYPFQRRYGVFANFSSSSIAHNWVRVDDEDSGKSGNSYDWHGITDNSIKDRIKKIIEGGDNTIYHTLKWLKDDTGLPAMSSLWRAPVGVIKVDDKASCQKTFTITLDAENKNNNTKVIAGSSNHPGISLGGTVSFNYCVIEGANIPKARYDYVVLRKGRYCPAGTYPFARYHDLEDTDNKNSPKNKASVVWPSVVDDNARLEYCFVPQKSGGKAYPFSASYGVFAANPSMSNIIYTEFRIDDEDSGPCVKEDWPAAPSDGSAIEPECVEYGNNNAWYWYGASSDIQKRIKNIIRDKNHDTYFRYIHWNGKSLSKSAEVVEAPAVGEIAPSAAVSLSPEIKGFDHSAVTVEIKSAGKIVVSIMNIRGDVVATVSQDNLLPGIHMVKWNSGVVPNGRYVVAVKQNGKISAKNVILK
ncbi:hypothetical protein [uncultured Fibrobacter sp.]|uniref:hypothetical protein n=1 Tax=uncultured Fibrobacter sp. TaxID=261512 RepID=UPI0025E627AD|nr:hypothetical protein [uncultured Fibrobacter sp.]